MALKICLDTNIIRDHLDSRNKRSVFLLEYLRDNKIPVIASAYSLMELSDQHKDSLFFYKKFVKEKRDYTEFASQRRAKDLGKQDLFENNEYVGRVFDELKFIKWLTLSKEAWQLMLDYSRTTNIDAPDIIHLATAYLTECSYLVTNDGNFMKHANNLLKERAEEEKQAIKLKVVNVEQVIKEISKP